MEETKVRGDREEERHSDRNMTKSKGYCRRGVPQGTSVSPTLFNILMDALADTIIGLDINDGLDNAMRVNVLADDVVILGHSKTELQSLLDTCTEWAQEKEWHGRYQSVQ